MIGTATARAHTARSPRLLACLLLAALPLLPSCGGEPAHACTLIGCADGYDVSLQPDAAWPAGEYTFTLTADDATQRCTARIPLPSCDTPAVACEGEALAMIGASGCALPGAQQGFASIRFAGAPEHVHVTLAKDGATLVERDLTPVYTTSQPNGPGCEPVCRNASDTVAVPFG